MTGGPNRGGAERAVPSNQPPDVEVQSEDEGLDETPRQPSASG
jgi:hypothetical protein